MCGIMTDDDYEWLVWHGFISRSKAYIHRKMYTRASGSLQVVQVFSD